MNPVVALVTLRLGFFILPLGVLGLLGVPTPYAVGGAALLSIALSWFFLRAQRQRVADFVNSRIERRLERRNGEPRQR